MGHKASPNIVRLSVRIVPRARSNEISAILPDGRIKIRLIAPPVDGKANASLIKFLADQLDIPKSKITILSGQKSREKVIQIEGVSESYTNKRIQNKLKKKV